ncbi:hypothetical protein ETD83_08900 [Actinomadura soli]|uniref:Uncharacterized protein n=1 Tax=Actinomadura soli TaxID=2508997 RepID=A0A5C4JI83_9ACTN|nr:hypothetical protein [Actinomadura soli]TMR04280.1 hypothetical protein ETD83_08900 [Actinomadura soli]
MRHVFLDPDGGQRDWLYLVPLCGTGGSSGRDGLLELREIFEKARRGPAAPAASSPPICSIASGRRSA